MPAVTITASNAGFFNLSPLGAMLAPNVFLRTGVNVDGGILGSSDGWKSAESAMYTDFGIDVIAQFEGDPTAALGESAKVTVIGLEFFRIVDGVRILTGTMDLPEPIILDAIYDQIGPNSFAWCADLGAALEEVLQHEGFVFKGGAGVDIFDAHASTLTLYGKNVIRGHGGDDILTGGLGDDRIYGGAGDDTLHDDSGTNRLFGRSGDDVLTLGVESQHSRAFGGRGDDTLISDIGNDWLHGGAGDDTLIGGRGNDRLVGGRGADEFVFNATERGHDRIVDFTDGEDLMVFRALDSFDQLTLEQTARGTVISWDNDATILLRGVDAETIDASDFLFI